MSKLLSPPDIFPIAKKAGEILLEVQSSKLDIDQKSDGSPVTNADLLSNEVVVEGLKKLGPQFPIISEESGNDIAAAKTFWLVDPLDGTKDYIRGEDDFTVNIALIENRKPILSVIFAPKYNEFFCAQSGEGSYKVDYLGQRHPLPLVDEKKSSSLRVCISRTHFSREVKTYLEKLKSNFSDIFPVAIGSSLKLCRLAEGVVDLYPRTERLGQWDIASGHLLLTESGGSIFNFNNYQTIFYGDSPYQADPFLAISHHYVGESSKFMLAGP